MITHNMEIAKVADRIIKIEDGKITKKVLLYVLLIILALIWRWTGYNMVFYLSGMQNIEYSIYEAAKIDGASPLQTFFKITIPLLKPMILLTTITSTNGTLQLFDESLNLTNGGPGKSTMTMSHYIYNMSFVQSPNFGYAAAMSILILIMVAILALIQLGHSSSPSDSCLRLF